MLQIGREYGEKNWSPPAAEFFYFMTPGPTFSQRELTAWGAAIRTFPTLWERARKVHKQGEIFEREEGGRCGGEQGERPAEDPICGMASNGTR